MTDSVSLAVSAEAAMFDVIAEEAVRESRLWADALLPSHERRHVSVFSTLCAPSFALGVETVYEGYLLHYGISRLFAPADDDTALLLGDYLYAHGLVRIAATGSTSAVRDLAELISLCAQARANGSDDDWVVWAATCATLGEDALDGARAVLRQQGDPSALEAAARGGAPEDALELALTAHRACTT